MRSSIGTQERRCSAVLGAASSVEQAAVSTGVAGRTRAKLKHGMTSIIFKHCAIRDYAMGHLARFSLNHQQGRGALTTARNLSPKPPLSPQALCCFNAPGRWLARPAAAGCRTASGSWPGAGGCAHRQTACPPAGLRGYAHAAGGRGRVGLRAVPMPRSALPLGEGASLWKHAKLSQAQLSRARAMLIACFFQPAIYIAAGCSSPPHTAHTWVCVSSGHNRQCASP